jgi:hypothetical protein
VKILEYNDLNISGIKKNYDKIIGFIKNDNFKQANVKKLPNYGLYRAKLDDSNRILFKIMKYNGEKYALILEVIYNHAYDKSKFLRGAKIDDLKNLEIDDDKPFDTDIDAPELFYVNPDERRFHLLDKIFSFDDVQFDAYRSQPPLIIIGPAGSGKTALMLEKMKLFTGEGLYITLSQYLVENSRNIYYGNNYQNDNQNLSFLSFSEYLQTVKIPAEKEIDFKIFSQWFYKIPKQNRVADGHQLYEEFRGVLTGFSINTPYLSKEEYLSLGIRQSIFLFNERELVYSLFEKYLLMLKNNNLYDPNILAHGYLNSINKRYDFIVVDEVQDITNVQLKCILNGIKNESKSNFILSGDSNQVVHPNFFSWSNLKTMLYNNMTFDIKRVTKILQSNFRNSKSITDISNIILKIKQKRFGSIDKESTYLMNSLSKESGEILFLKDTDKVKTGLNKKAGKSTKFAVIVMRDDEKPQARRYFDTPLIFNIFEIKGLEYDNIILLNFISSEKNNFENIIGGITEDDLKNDLEYMRSANKKDKSLEEYKFFINSLYVAFTRSIKRLFIIENDTRNPIFKLLGLGNAIENIAIESEQSSDKEWLIEARKLEIQGKQEQADEIRKKILKQQQVPWEINTENKILELINKIKTSKDNPVRPRKIVFDYALFYNIPKIIEFLSVHNYDKAKQIYFINKQDQKQNENRRVEFNGNLYEQQKKSFNLLYSQKIQTANILKMIELYGINYRDEFNVTPLMAAVKTGNLNLINELINAQADKELTDGKGMNAWQIALEKAIFSKDYADKIFPLINDILSPSSISLKINGSLVKIDRKQGEFLIFQILYVLLSNRFSGFALDEIYISANEIYYTISHFNSDIIADYRKKNSYISSMLSNHELMSKYQYCKRLFIRMKRGYYVINPSIEILQAQKWISIYKLSIFDFIGEMMYEEKNYHEKAIDVLLNTTVKTKRNVI